MKVILNFFMYNYWIMVFGGYSSFCRIGDYVTMGGRAAVRDHVSIASKVSYSEPCIH